MFGDAEGLLRTTTTTKEEESGVVEVFVEERSSEWFVTYYVYKDKCIAVESMGDNYNHCTAECDSLGDAIATAGRWC